MTHIWRNHTPIYPLLLTISSERRDYQNFAFRTIHESRKNESFYRPIIPWTTKSTSKTSRQFFIHWSNHTVRKLSERRHSKRRRIHREVFTFVRPAKSPREFCDPFYASLTCFPTPSVAFAVSFETIRWKKPFSFDSACFHSHFSLFSFFFFFFPFFTSFNATRWIKGIPWTMNRKQRLRKPANSDGGVRGHGCGSCRFSRSLIYKSIAWLVPSGLSFELFDQTWPCSRWNGSGSWTDCRRVEK